MRLLSAFISPAKWSVRAKAREEDALQHCRSVRGGIALARSRSLGNVNFESGPLKKERIHKEEGSSSTSLRLSYSEGLRILWRRGLVSNGRRAD